MMRKTTVASLLILLLMGCDLFGPLASDSASKQPFAPSN